MFTTARYSRLLLMQKSPNMEGNEVNANSNKINSVKDFNSVEQMSVPTLQSHLFFDSPYLIFQLFLSSPYFIFQAHFDFRAIYPSHLNHLNGKSVEIAQWRHEPGCTNLNANQVGRSECRMLRSVLHLGSVLTNRPGYRKRRHYVTSLSVQTQAKSLSSNKKMIPNVMKTHCSSC